MARLTVSCQAARCGRPSPASGRRAAARSKPSIARCSCAAARRPRLCRSVHGTGRIAVGPGPGAVRSSPDRAHRRTGRWRQDGTRRAVPPRGGRLPGAPEQRRAVGGAVAVRGRRTGDAGCRNERHQTDVVSAAGAAGRGADQRRVDSVGAVRGARGEERARPRRRGRPLVGHRLLARPSVRVASSGLRASADPAHRAQGGRATSAGRATASRRRGERVDSPPGSADARSDPDPRGGTRRPGVLRPDRCPAGRAHSGQSAVRAGVAGRGAGRSLALVGARAAGSAGIRRAVGAAPGCLQSGRATAGGGDVGDRRDGPTVHRWCRGGAGDAAVRAGRGHRGRTPPRVRRTEARRRRFPAPAGAGGRVRAARTRPARSAASGRCRARRGRRGGAAPQGGRGPAAGRAPGR